MHTHVGTVTTLQVNECNGSTETTGKVIQPELFVHVHACVCVIFTRRPPPPPPPLQHEVATLEVSAKKQATFFTPYLVPDAHSLCTGLHLVKKLLTSEKFIFVIAKSSKYTCNKF